jgi:hypothetical protein
MRVRAILAGLLLSVLFVAGWGSAAHAQTYPIPSPPTSISAIESAKADPAQVLGTQTTRGGLALTGADIAGMVLLGGGLVVAGTVVWRAGRRRPAV